METIWGKGGGGVRGGTIGHVRYLTVRIKRGELGRFLGTDRSGGKRRPIYQRAVLEEAVKVIVVTATATVMATETEATKITEVEWEDTPKTRGLGKD